MSPYRSPHRPMLRQPLFWALVRAERRSTRRRSTEWPAWANILWLVGAIAIAVWLFGCNGRAVLDERPRPELVVQRYPLATRVEEGQPTPAAIDQRAGAFATCDDDEVTLSGGCWWDGGVAAVINGPALGPDGKAIVGWYCEGGPSEGGAVTAYAVCGR